MQRYNFNAYHNDNFIPLASNIVITLLYYIYLFEKIYITPSPLALRLLYPLNFETV